MELSRQREAESQTMKREIKQRDQELRKLECIETLIMQKLQGHLLLQKEMIDDLEQGKFDHSKYTTTSIDAINNNSLNTIDEYSRKRRVRALQRKQMRVA
jgi:hypothetical protein